MRLMCESGLVVDGWYSGVDRVPRVGAGHTHLVKQVVCTSGTGQPTANTKTSPADWTSAGTAFFSLSSVNP